LSSKVAKVRETSDFDPIEAFLNRDEIRGFVSFSTAKECTSSFEEEEEIASSLRNFVPIGSPSLCDILF
jgi:hypothetical protein